MMTTLLQSGPLQYTFMQHALLAVLLLAPLYALLGVLVINNRMAFFADTISHAGLIGIALGTWFGWQDPSPALIIIGLLMTFCLLIFERIARTSLDTNMSILSAFTTALGLTFLSKGGLFAKYSRFLIGDILSISSTHLVYLSVLLLVILFFIFRFFNILFLASLNSSLAHSRHRHARYVQAAFACIVAIVVSMSIPWVGILVVNALLILPSFTARYLAKDVKSYIAWALVLSSLAGVGGLFTSYYFSTATGATIVLIAMGFFITAICTKQLANYFK